MKRRFLLAPLCFAIALAGYSQARSEEWKPIPRVLPPTGIKLTDAQREQINSALQKLEMRIKARPRGYGQSDYFPDVAIYEKAVRFAMLNDEFYSDKDVPLALAEIATATERLHALAHDEHPWTTQHGQLVRGYRSAIDDSFQPYGLEIPEGLDLSKPVPLYVWLHGRGDKDTDMHFIHGREGHKGQIQPAGAIVMHAFGRQCLGFKSAGEIDVLEAIDAVEHAYSIDPDRVVLMGFSMGGAGAWHLGAHYADHFAAVHAGAGFIDVAKYQHLKPEEYPAWYEQKLWGDYDVPDYVRNLFNVPMVAYGGEIDPQRALSAIMEEEFKAQGHQLVRIVGPKMPHKYDPASLAEIMRQMNEAVIKGRNSFPAKVFLQTRTLRYNHMFWASMTRLQEHWIDSRLDAEAKDEGHVAVTTVNVDGFALTSPWRDSAKTPADREIEIQINGAAVPVHLSDFRNGKAEFVLSKGGWKQGPLPANEASPLHKRHLLQGPIDDAFMGPFLVVIPTANSTRKQVQQWVDFEIQHFQNRWREAFRGELRIKKDSEVTPDDIQRFHLVLWGDEQSNKLIAQTLGKLPLKWSANEISIGGKTYDAGSHMPLAIYPNPLNPTKYVVLNSGPTFREASDHTNSLQNPKLPDWAVIDITTPPDGKSAGKVEDAGFFDENWRVKAK